MDSVPLGGLWALNIDAYAKSRHLRAIDLIGKTVTDYYNDDPIKMSNFSLLANKYLNFCLRFGQVLTSELAQEVDEVVEQHLEMLEGWRKAIGLEKFIPLVHSMGGYLSAAYALKNPQNKVKLLNFILKSLECINLSLLQNFAFDAAGSFQRCLKISRKVLWRIYLGFYSYYRNCSECELSKFHDSRATFQ
jgi:pimeloyl-ACP methyl ester carboxylesterase